MAMESVVHYEWACAPTACLQLGSGDYAFSKLHDGDAIEMIAGVQGGYHIVAGIQVLNMALGDDGATMHGDPTVDFDMYMRGERVDAAPASRTHLAPVDETGLRFELVGHHVMFETEAVQPFDQNEGAMLVLAVTVTDADGVRHTMTSVELVIAVRS